MKRMMQLDLQDVAALIQEEMPDAYVALVEEAIDPWIEIEPEWIAEVCQFVRDVEGIEMDMLNCITVVDYCEPDPKKAKKAGFEPHLMLVYHLSSTKYKTRLVLKAKSPRWQDDMPGKLPEVPSVSEIWKTANWHERELYDLSGVYFTDHPDLRRILCPEDWEGHPLRKDYQMPLEYHGIRGR